LRVLRGDWQWSSKSEGEAYPLICHPIEASQLLHRAKMFMDNQANLALMARTAITPEEEEASLQPEKAVVQLGEFFQGPPFPVECMRKIQSF
jgi:hypothetical protein